MSIPRLSSKETEIIRLLVAHGEMYGLELVEQSELLGRGTVYVTLSRMADKGYVESRLEDKSPGEGPPRRMYRATGLGQRAYQAAEHASQLFFGKTAWNT